MRDNVKPLSPEEDVFWWKMDDNHHQSITIYSSEDVVKKHKAELEEFRKKSSIDYSIKMVEEIMGLVIAQMSKLYQKYVVFLLFNNQNLVFVTNGKL